MIVKEKEKQKEIEGFGEEYENVEWTDTPLLVWVQRGIISHVDTV
jgi:hypothetical protein